jgi:TadE-like protein
MNSFMICYPIFELSSRAQRGICSFLNIKPFARKLESTDGAEIAEAALVLPLVFMLLLGIVWFGRAFNIYSTITQAAQQGAITAARSSCVTCGDNPSSDTTVETAIAAVLQASSLEPGQIKQAPKPVLPPCPSPPAPPGGCTKTGNNIWVCRSMQLNLSADLTQPPQCGTVVSFQYPFQFYLPFTSLNMQKIILSAQAQSRMEN